MYDIPHSAGQSTKAMDSTYGTWGFKQKLLQGADRPHRCMQQLEFSHEGTVKTEMKEGPPSV